MNNQEHKTQNSGDYYQPVELPMIATIIGFQKQDLNLYFKLLGLAPYPFGYFGVLNGFTDHIVT